MLLCVVISASGIYHFFYPIVNPFGQQKAKREQSLDFGKFYRISSDKKFNCHSFIYLLLETCLLLKVNTHLSAKLSARGLCLSFAHNGCKNIIYFFPVGHWYSRIAHHLVSVLNQNQMVFCFTSPADKKFNYYLVSFSNKQILLSFIFLCLVIDISFSLSEFSVFSAF
ncbi:unnamed protein product [Acanthosepion pharaonis]|uniref:Uncharacterized protein n=1 Tax=Acanthosepion pharaonis TaxID=158019 RepID=A0A812E0I9_ACAPH|nr:unnamed protein product [Sepia pharaonis]